MQKPMLRSKRPRSLISQKWFDRLARWLISLPISHSQLKCTFFQLESEAETKTLHWISTGGRLYAWKTIANKIKSRSVLFRRLDKCTQLKSKRFLKSTFKNLHPYKIRGVFRILILWVLNVYKICNQHPQFFPTVLKCPTIAGANSLFLKIVGASPVLNTHLISMFNEYVHCKLKNGNIFTRPNFWTNQNE